ncbi:phenylalanyl-tRNA synthetase beta subunit [Sanguibacter keddieii DSM 10542]|uniref:Phenylalanine--tRNA ligase beta subunit n=1 Tax=Sanguibacter keddieii (strain ATCC 51767 / DSM 10542 / NCFB 3025 / ST-74) TaxID=446469 RepID=D1BIH5_SANKS|nr:phenylalanine--tRNA ligase subunit beta [Sanguibacter keddieii]ACZ22152.1 phenylalanyl-tRNA synthetase beta subunit [Sanguibacter keddieii DSM 10542]
MPNIPLTWLGEHVELPAGLTAEQLAVDLVRVGLEEEEVHGAAVTGPLVVVRVLSLVKEPQKNGKVINWCQVDAGAHNTLDDDGRPTVPRGIVCGAHNFVEGDLVVAALPGTVLPGPFPIAARKTYGHVSDGMICSTSELGLGEGGDGIIVLDPAVHAGVEPGDDAIALLGLGEEVLEINVTPDRGYCFSMRGVAREYSHSTGARFTDPGLPSGSLPGATADGFEVVVEDDAPVHGVAGCDRFVTRVVRGVDASAASPAWMQRRLTQAGMRPISLAVDATNYVMLDLGQPLHAYDLSTLVAPVVVRRATTGERLVTLDGTDRALDTGDLLITDSAGGRGARVLGLAGVMGGAETEVSYSTTDVLVEAAHFDPISVARTARRHRLPSEAAKRFERGVDPRLAAVAAQRVVDLLVEHGGGTADPAVSDLDAVPERPVVEMALTEPARLVGVDYTRDQVVGTLEQIGCTVVEQGATGTLLVTVPTWRPDLTGAAELVEEVARLVGYDQIPSVLPVAPAGSGLTRGQRARRSVARGLAEHGLAEVLSYPFVGQAQLDELGLPADDERRTMLSLVNPISAEKGQMRSSLLVTLLDTARRNVARGRSDLALFELGLVTLPVAGAPAAPALPVGQRPSDEQLAAVAAAVPAQPRHVAGVLAGSLELPGWWGTGRAADWTDALAAVRLVAERAGAEIVVSSTSDRAPWHPGRCAEVRLTDGTVVGHAGELHPKVVEQLALPARTVAFEVDLDALVSAAPTEPRQAGLVSTFPLAKEDLALVVDAGVPAQDVFDAVRDGAGDLLEDLRLFDVFTGEQVGEGKKSLAFSLRLRAQDRTLTAQDTVAVREAAVASAAARVGAELRA